MKEHATGRAHDRVHERVADRVPEHMLMTFTRCHGGFPVPDAPNPCVSCSPDTPALSPEQKSILAAGKRVITTEAAGLAALEQALDGEFVRAVETLNTMSGRVIVAGVGKSGHVGRKIAATLASTGTPAQFVHPTEASHGDLGMITPDDVVLALSKSGNTSEFADLIAYTRRFAITLIAITTGADSQLARGSDILLALPGAPEACGETGAPTTSTTLQMAMGDALAVALLEHKGFSATDFRRFHPGGALGAMLSKVSDLMHTGEALPLVGRTTPMADALVDMTAKGFGCAGVVDDAGRLVGVITDGDLRRHMGPAFLAQTADAVMTRNPRTVSPDGLAADALRDMTAGTAKITVLFAVDDAGVPVGILHLHDCLRVGLA